MTRALQYCSSICCSDNDRFSVVIVFSGYRSRGAFLSSGHPMVLTLRNAMQTTSAWCWFRNRKYRQSPLNLARLDDKRLTHAQKSETDVQFRSTRVCKLDWGLGRKLKRRLMDTESLLDEGRNKRLCSAIKRTWVENGGLEALHSRNQRHNDQSTSWPMFCADFVNSTSKMLESKSDQLRADAFSALAAVPDVAVTSPTAIESRPGETRLLPKLSNVCELIDSMTSADIWLPGNNVHQIIHKKIIREAKLRNVKLPNVCTGLWPRVDAQVNRLKNSSPEEFRRLTLIGTHNAMKKRKQQHNKDTTTLRNNNATAGHADSAPSDTQLCDVTPLLSLTC